MQFPDLELFVPSHPVGATTPMALASVFFGYAGSCHLVMALPMRAPLSLPQRTRLTRFVVDGEASGRKASGLWRRCRWAFRSSSPSGDVRSSGTMSD
jgi:hypothetical protein